MGTRHFGTDGPSSGRGKDMHVQSTATFEAPIAATRGGKPVRILAVGDEPNSSPVYLYVDESGDSGWAPISGFQINDTNCLPLSQNALGLEIVGQRR